LKYVKIAILYFQIQNFWRHDVKKIAEFIKGAGDIVSDAVGVAAEKAGSSFSVAKDTAAKTGHLAAAFGKSAGDTISSATHKTIDMAGAAGSAVADATEKSLVTLKAAAETTGQSAATAGRKVGSAFGATADATLDLAGKAAVLVGDLNGDGKFDFEDAKIAAAKAKEVVVAAAGEVGKLSKEALQSDLVKDAAAGAMVGGAIASAIPVPLVSTVGGAVVGAALGAYKNIGKK